MVVVMTLLFRLFGNGYDDDKKTVKWSYATFYINRKLFLQIR